MHIIDLALFVFAVILPKHVSDGTFVTKCEKGVIDFGREFMEHLEENFPEVTECASREMTNIYSHAVKLVTNREEERQLHGIYAGIGVYLKGCNELFNLNETMAESMDTIEEAMSKMKVEKVCYKPPEKVCVFKEIMKTRVVSKILSLEYFDNTFSILVKGAAKTLDTLINSALCILKKCSGDMKKMLKQSINAILLLAKDFLGDVLADIQTGLQKVFKGRFEKLECDVDKDFKQGCDFLNEEVDEIKRKLGRQLRNYRDCLDDKSRVVQRIKNFQRMKTHCRF